MKEIAQRSIFLSDETCQSDGGVAHGLGRLSLKHARSAIRYISIRFFVIGVFMFFELLARKLLTKPFALSVYRARAVHAQEACLERASGQARLSSPRHRTRLA